MLNADQKAETKSRELWTRMRYFNLLSFRASLFTCYPEPLGETSFLFTFKEIYFLKKRQ